MDNKTRIKRLRHAIWVMQQVPDERLYMHSWVAAAILSDPVLLPDNFIEVDCQTACCFLGHLGLDKTCRKEGLKTNLEAEHVFYMGEYGVHAAKAYFGIRYGEAYDLTESFTYYVESIKPEDVITRLDKLIKKYQSM